MKSETRSLLVVVLASAMMLAYQNCGAPTATAVGDGSGESGVVRLQSKPLTQFEIERTADSLDQTEEVVTPRGSFRRPVQVWTRHEATVEPTASGVRVRVQIFEAAVAENGQPGEYALRCAVDVTEPETARDLSNAAEALQPAQPGSKICATVYDPIALRLRFEDGTDLTSAGTNGCGLTAIDPLTRETIDLGRAAYRLRRKVENLRCP